MAQGMGGADNLLLATQPIFDRADNIHGVELLYRNEQGLSALDVGEDQATAEVVYQLCTAISQKAVHYQAPVFINVSTDLLLTRDFLPISPEHVVIELVERIAPMPAVVEAVSQLYRRGYRFALDDFAFAPEWEPLLPMASYIKVDIQTMPLVDIRAKRERFAHLKTTWIAERIETREERDAYLGLGFELFQGYFYARPVPVYGKKIPPTTLQATRLLKELCCSEPDMGKIIHLIESDPDLAIKLIRIANSAYYRPHSPIGSVQDVVIRLGLRQLSGWITLFGLLGNAASEHAELALTRAKACEMLAQRDRLNAQDAYFIGLLSTVELLLGVPREEFLGCLELDAATSDALLHRAGVYGNLLERIEGTERQFAMPSMTPCSDNACLLDIYHQAHHQAYELLTALSMST